VLIVWLNRLFDWLSELNGNDDRIYVNLNCSIVNTYIPHVDVELRVKWKEI